MSLRIPRCGLQLFYEEVYTSQGQGGLLLGTFQGGVEGSEIHPGGFPDMGLKVSTKRVYTLQSQRGLTLDVFLGKSQRFRDMLYSLPKCGVKGSRIHPRDFLGIRSKVLRTSHQFQALAKTLKELRTEERKKDRLRKQVQRYKGDLAQGDIR